MKLLNEILGTKYPIIQGGMANIATGEFAAACSNAGALGVIGAGGVRSAEDLRAQIRRCKELTDKPFGVNLMLMHPLVDEFAQVVIEEKVPVVTTGAGNPGKYVPAWKEAGIKVIPVVAAAVLAKHLEKSSVDAIIAEGTESGGHVGEMATMALVPQVVDAVNLPVIAAGGIADGRQLAAALALGACGRLCRAAVPLAFARYAAGLPDRRVHGVRARRLRRRRGADVQAPAAQKALHLLRAAARDAYRPPCLGTCHGGLHGSFGKHVYAVGVRGGRRPQRRARHPFAACAHSPFGHAV